MTGHANIKAKIRARTSAGSLQGPAGDGDAVADSGAPPMRRSASAASLASPPPASRPRVSGPSEPSSSPRGAASSPNAAGATDELSQQVEYGKECLGCYRQFGVDMSFMSAQTPLVWMYQDGKGTWCRDCNNVYRLMLKARMPAAFFERWLGQSAANRQQWSRLLLSYLSLKYDGQNHVTPAMVESRLKMLTWLFEMLQLPWPACAVKPVTPEFLQSMLSHPDRYLATSQSGDDVFGLEPLDLPLGLRSTTRRIMTRAQATRQWPFLPWTSLPGNFETMWAQEIGSGELVAGASLMPEIEDSAGSIVPAAPAPAANSVLAKVEVMEDSVRMMMQSFMQGGTSGTKERDFNPLFTKASKMKQELLESSTMDPMHITKLEVLAKVCFACTKSGKRRALQGMLDSMSALESYASSEAIPLGSEFGAAFVQAKFHQLCESSLPDALQFLIDFDYAWSKPSMTEDTSPSSPPRIIHSCIMCVLLGALRHEVPNDPALWDAKKLELAEDTDKCLACVQCLQKSWASLDRSIKVLQALRLVLEAAKGTNSMLVPREVAAAKSTLNEEPSTPRRGSHLPVSASRSQVSQTLWSSRGPWTTRQMKSF